jgi:hypothetical protein
MGVRWNGSEEKSQEEEGWQEEKEVTLFPHLRASLVASKLGVTGDARKTTSLSEEFASFVRSFRLASSLTEVASQGNFGT